MTVFARESEKQKVSPFSPDRQNRREDWMIFKTSIRPTLPTKSPLLASEYLRFGPSDIAHIAPAAEIPMSWRTWSYLQAFAFSPDSQMASVQTRLAVTLAFLGAHQSWYPPRVAIWFRLLIVPPGSDRICY